MQQMLWGEGTILTRLEDEKDLDKQKRERWCSTGWTSVSDSKPCHLHGNRRRVHVAGGWEGLEKKAVENDGLDIGREGPRMAR